jgi:hypothetical protein
VRVVHRQGVKQSSGQKTKTENINEDYLMKNRKVQGTETTVNKKPLPSLFLNGKGKDNYPND